MNQKLIDKVKAKKEISSDFIVETMNKVADDHETAEELAFYFMKEGASDVLRRGEIFKLFPDYIKLDASKYQRLFCEISNVSKYVLNPYPNLFEDGKHSFILPTYESDNACADMALIDGKFYDRVCFYTADMAKVAANPNNFFTAQTWHMYKPEKDIRMLKEIAFRSLEVEEEQCDTDAEKARYHEYAKSVREAIEEKIKLEFEKNNNNENE